MTPIQLHNFANFIFNTDLAQARQIFQSKVPDWQLEEILISTVELKLINKGQNRLAWLDFVSSLDEDQLQILLDHIAESYK